MCQGKYCVMNISFDDYMDSIKANRKSMPPELISFASNEDHYELNHPQSLHDSWVSSLCTEELRNNTRPYECSLRVTLKLLGQQHDRTLVLIYSDVVAYEFLGSENSFNPNDTFHGDILDHRISITGDAYKHIIEMRSGSIFKVVFKGFSFEEQSST